ncbi:MAG: 50S ribosomal protein L31 [Acholeplasmatales bacterium]|jgi:large subunit ribosomal protein L31|nr:50S ribosomal protein L31 [Acholeplasmatales bacterium]
MKEKIQPKYHVVKVKCSTCGSEFEIGTTSKDLRIDVCSNCHPFYTGKQTFVAKAGRVEKFQQRQSKAETPKEKVIVVEETEAEDKE